MNNIYRTIENFKCISEGRYDDQIIVLKDLLKIQPNNEGAQSDLAQAYEKSGRDPLDVYKSRFESNPNNISYGLDYSDKLLEADRPSQAIDILKQVLKCRHQFARRY